MNINRLTLERYKLLILFSIYTNFSVGLVGRGGGGEGEGCVLQTAKVVLLNFISTIFIYLTLPIYNAFERSMRNEEMRLTRIVIILERSR